MKWNLPLQRVSIYIAILVALPVQAQTLTWDPTVSASNTGGGTGTWDMGSTANWWNGSADVVWPGAGTDNDAVFGGAAGTVTVSSVTANDLTFNTTAYTLVSGTLTLNGTTPTVTVGSGLSASISSTISGSVGLKLEGGGTLNLGGAAAFTGGNFEIGASSANNNLNVADGGKLTSSSTGTVLRVGASTLGGNSLSVSTAGTSGAPSLRAQSLTLGGSSSNNTLTVSNGAYVSVLGANSSWVIGNDAGANANSLVITGAGSTVDRSAANGSAINVGVLGDSNFVRVESGGKLAPKRIVIGQGGDNNYVLITGAGSQYDGQSYVQTVFQVGFAAAAVGNSFRVENGATGTVGTTANQTSRPFSIGGSASGDGSNNNYVLVSGSGSSLTLINTNPVAIGGQITGGNATPTIIDSSSEGNTAAGNHIDVFGGGSLNIGGGTSATSLYVMGVNSALNLGNGNGISTATVGTSGGVFSPGVLLKNSDSRLNFNGGRLTAGATGSLVSGVGQIQLNGPSYFSTTFSGSTISSVIGGTGTLTKEGSGTLELSGANTYTGATKVTAGVLQLANSLALQGSALDSSGAGVVSLSGLTSLTLGGLTGSTNLASVITTGLGSVTALTLNPGTGGADTYSGVIADGAVGMTLTKAGSGTQILSGTNTYTGATTVNAGVLRVNGSISSASSVTVGSGGALGGNGTIHGGTTIQSGGSLAPGNSPGLLTFGDFLTLSSGATSSFEINGDVRGTNYDAVDVTGLTTLGGTLALSFGSTLANGTTLDLFNFIGGNTGNFSAITATGSYVGSFTAGSDVWQLTSGGQLLTFTVSTGDLGIMVGNAVPEPSTYAAILGATGLAFALLAKRRQRAS